MTLLQAFLLGLIEGITEFLPISSTAHLIIAQKLMGIDQTSISFNTIVQLGAIIAITLYFRHELITYCKELFGTPIPDLITSLKDRQLTGLPTLLALALATIPVLIMGFIFKDSIDIWQDNPYIIAATSAIVALFLWYAQKTAPQHLTKLTPKIYLILGLWQVLALLPGVSRSGIIILGGLFWGLSLPTVLQAAFLLSIPTLAAAGGYELLSLLSNPISSADPSSTFIATCVAFISAYCVIHYLLTFIRSVGLMPFVWYRLAFAIGILLVTLS